MIIELLSVFLIVFYISIFYKKNASFVFNFWKKMEDFGFFWRKKEGNGRLCFPDTDNFSSSFPITVISCTFAAQKFFSRNLEQDELSFRPCS